MSSPAMLFRKYLWRVIACALPIVALLRGAWQRQAEVMLWPQLTQAPDLDDTNIWMRLEQVRQGLASVGSQNHVLIDTNASGLAIERVWTRLMDILIAAFHSLTPNTWAEEIRLMVAAAWLPAVLGIIAFAILARATLKRFNNWHVLFTLVFLLAVSPLSGYFTPGDVDRHSIILLMWCGVLVLLLEPLTKCTAALAGAMLGVMIWGDVESLAPVAVIFALVGYTSLRKHEELRLFAIMAVATAVAVAAARTIEIPFGCDLICRSMNIPWFARYLSSGHLMPIILVAGFALLAGVAWLVSCERVRNLPFKQRLLAAAVLLSVATGAFILLFKSPLLKILNSFNAYNSPDTVATEVTPLLEIDWSLALQHIWQPLLALALLIRLRRGRVSDATLGAVLAACCFLTLAQVRYSYYAQVAAVLVLAPLLPVYAMQMARGLPRTFRPYALLLGCCAVVIALAPPFDAPAVAETRACQAQMRYVIQTQQLQKLAGDKPRAIFAPVDVAGDIIFFTPYLVIAGEYGREDVNMRRLRAIASATKPEDALKLLKDYEVDSILFCPTQAPKGSWLAGKPPAWLAQVEGLQFTTKHKSLPVFYTVQK